MPQPAAPSPILPRPEIDRLRGALSGYTVDTVHALLGWTGQAAHSRGDLAGVARVARERRDSGDAEVRRLATLVQLFLLGSAVGERDAAAALHPLPLESACGAGLVTAAAGSARALVEIRPYAEAGPQPAHRDADPAPWWVVSDFGSDVRPGPLAADHVLGIGAASLTLAQATPRLPVERGLDIGTGCGVQALHLSRHTRRVTGTDVSERALRLAATTAALSGATWDLRRGSLLTPVAGERFDLVVANPPFVVSAGGVGYEYRDSGIAGDGVCRALVSGLPDLLAPGGTAQLLANWIVPAQGGWQERVAGWLSGRACDAWVWQRELADPGEYVTMWLRDAGEVPGTPRFLERYDAWLDWFAAAGVAAVGMGLITLWRSGATDPVVVMEDVPQAVEQPVGALLPDWHARQQWLAAMSDDALPSCRLRAGDALVWRHDDELCADGWRAGAARLCQTTGMRWEIEVDDAVAALVAGCDGTTPLLAPMTVLAASLDAPVADVASALAPVVRDLVSRGFLLPVPEGDAS